MKKKNRGFIILAALIVLAGVILSATMSRGNEKKTHAKSTDFQKCVASVESMRKEGNNASLPDRYKNLDVVDFQNLDANHYKKAEDLFNKYHIDQVGIGGWLASRDGILSDELAWEAYKSKPDFFYPYFASFDMHSPKGLETIQQNLEKGYVAVGEIAAASSFSDTLKDAEWKAQDPLDGNLPKLYELASHYKVPVILHIDPPQPDTEPMKIFEKALNKYPNTTFVFDTGNVFNSGYDLEPLLKKHKNLYISMYAGFNAYDQQSPNKLTEYVRVMDQYPNRFLLMSDSGYGITEDQAYQAIYQLIDLLKPKTVCEVAHQNMQTLIANQPPTKTQLDLIHQYEKKLNQPQKDPETKLEANKRLFELEKKLGIFGQTYTDITHLPTVQEAKNKAWARLTDQDRIVIGRDVLDQVEMGIFSSKSKEATHDFDAFYQKLFLKNALATNTYNAYKTYPNLNSYVYNQIGFSKEQIKKEKNDFIYTTNLLEDMTNIKTKKREVDHTLYRLYIVYDQHSHSYKIKYQMAVPLD
jgi:hypothetical protein